MNEKHNPKTSCKTILGRFAAVLSAVVLLVVQSVPSIAQQTGSQTIRFELRYKISKEYKSIASYIYCYGYKTVQDAQAGTNGTYLGRHYAGVNADGTQHSVILGTAAPQGVTFGGWRCLFRDHSSISTNGVGSGVPTPATYRGCLVGSIQGSRGVGGVCP